jgi:hypothetical protein
MKAALFNGKAAATLYAIGAATQSGTDPWAPDAGNPVLEAGTSGAWDDAGVKDPCLLRVGGQWVMYYSGYDGSSFRIGRATATDLAGPWTKYGSNPVLDLGAGGAFDDLGVSFPTVLYEPDDTGREWKMWYAGTESAGLASIGYAYSSDGLSWTKHGQVIDVGAGGTWNDESVIPGAVVKDGSTYYLFAGGRRDAATIWNGGLWTCSDPEGSYTADAGNPIMVARYWDTGVSQALTANTLTGSAVVKVGDTSVYSEGEPVTLCDQNSSGWVSTIASIDSGTQLTLTDTSPRDFTAGSPQYGLFRPLAMNSIFPRSVLRTGTGWEAYVTAFQPFEDVSIPDPKLREGSVLMTASALDGPWSYDYSLGLLLPLDEAGWDALSAENMWALQAAFSPPGFGAEAGFQSGVSFEVGANVTVFPAAFGAEAGFQLGISFRSGGARQVMLTGGGIETPEMTTGGAAGQVLTFNPGSVPTWEDVAAGTAALDDLTDVDAAAPDDGDALVWNAGTSTWIAAPPTGVADIVDLPTAEMDDSLVLAPDGAGGVEFRAETAGGGDVATDTIWDTKGDLAVGTGANTAAKLAAGTNGYLLTADSGETTGLKWVAKTTVFDPDVHMPRHIVLLPTLWLPDATTGTWAVSSAAESAGDYGLYKPGSTANSGGAQTWANAGSNAQNDACAWDIPLSAGTWTATFIVRKSTNTAIITLNQDGSSMGTVDTYAAAGAAARLTIAGWSVATTGLKRMQVKAASRNGSNTTGWILNFSAIIFDRTA